MCSNYLTIGLVSLAALVTGCLSPGDDGAGLRVAAIDIPEPYYFENKMRVDHTIDEAVRLVGVGFTTPYQVDSFDCSEMAAYLEWMLQNYGFDARICTSRSFGDTGEGHAWVALDFGERRYYIEPTANNYARVYSFTMIAPYDRRYSEYGNFDAIYDDIYDAALDLPGDEIDWWESLDFDLTAKRKFGVQVIDAKTMKGSA